MDHNISQFNAVIGVRFKICYIDKHYIYYLIKRRQRIYSIYQYNLYTKETITCGAFRGPNDEDTDRIDMRFFGNNLVHILFSPDNIDIFLNTSHIPWETYTFPINPINILAYSNNNPMFIIKQNRDVNLYNYITGTSQVILNQNIGKLQRICFNPSETHCAYITLPNKQLYIYEFRTNTTTPINISLQVMQEDDNKFMFWDADNIIWICVGQHIHAYNPDKNIYTKVQLIDNEDIFNYNTLCKPNNYIYTIISSETTRICIYKLHNFKVDNVLDFEINTEVGPSFLNMWVDNKHSFIYDDEANVITYHKIPTVGTNIQNKLLSKRFQLKNRVMDFESYFKPFINDVKKLNPRERDALEQRIKHDVKTKIDQFNTTHHLPTPSTEYLTKYFDALRRYYYRLIIKFHPNIDEFFNTTEQTKYNLVSKPKNDTSGIITTISKMNATIQRLLYKRNLQFNKYIEYKDDQHKQAYDKLNDQFLKRIEKYNKYLTDLMDVSHPKYPNKKLYTGIYPLIQSTLKEFKSLTQQPIPITNRSSSDISSVGKSSKGSGSSGRSGAIKPL